MFITGVGRSGTTLLGRILAAHPACTFLNEPKAIWHHLHGAEDVIGSYGTGTARFHLPQSDATPGRERRLARLYRWATILGGGPRVVDKYPELIFRLEFLRALCPTAQVIALTRDGVETCHSIATWSGRRRGTWWGRADRKWNMMVAELVGGHPTLGLLRAQIAPMTQDQDRAAVEWIVTMTALRQALQDQDDWVRRVDYADLCGAAEATLTDLLAWVGLTRDQGLLTYAQQMISAQRPRRSLHLHPILVGPFKQALTEMGYAASTTLVEARVNDPNCAVA